MDRNLLNGVFKCVARGLKSEIDALPTDPESPNMIIHGITAP